MSSRALRKLRDHEQRKQLQQTVSQSDEEYEVEERNSLDKRPTNAFDMLLNGGEEDASTDGAGLSEEDMEEETKASIVTEVSSASTFAKPRNKSKKKKNKRSTKGAKAESKVQSTGEKVTSDRTGKKDEIDRALESLAIKSRDGSYTLSNPPRDESYTQLCRLLEVESKHLNALNEMKRLFGHIMESEEERFQPARRRGRVPQQLDLGGALTARYSPVSKGQGLAGLALRRNVFIAGKEEWPKATSGGLGMEIDRTDGDGTKHYRFVHNTAYQDIQRQFQSCVESMDPQRMIHMLQFNPYHISTILQVSEIAKQQGDHSVSGDLLERALFSFGRSVHSSFANALAEGKARLDFRRPENREFWLAGWRYIGNLGQRGTWRTAYEWGKLLLAMDPQIDPYCVKMVVDQLAIRGGQAEHLLKLSSLAHDKTWNNLLNIQISFGLAKFKLKESDESRASLRIAVRNFPWVFTRLFKELNIEHIPKSIWGKTPRTDRERLECECYVHGAKDLWNTPDTISFLVEVVDTTEAMPNPPKMNQPITLNEARHVLLSGVPQLIALIPREYTSMQTSSSDPLPPTTSIQSYTSEIPASHRGPAAVYAGPFEAFSSDEDGASEPEEELEVPRRPPPAPTDTASTAGEGTHDHMPDPTSEPGWLTSFFSRFRAWPNPNVGRPAEGEAAANLVQNEIDAVNRHEDSTAAEELAYDEDANKRWLAGRGLMQLKDFVAEHGTDESTWSSEYRPENIVTEYAARVELLRETSRKFILDYTLRQGTNQATKELVMRQMGR